MIQVFDWIFKDIFHFAGIIMLAIIFFGGMANVVKAAKGSGK